MAPARDDRSKRLGLRGLSAYAVSVCNLRNLLAPPFFGIVRSLGGPVVRPPWGDTAYVLRWAEARSVLERPEDFSVRIFAARMRDTTGITFLGMDPSERYALEAGALRAALEVPDARPGAAPGSAQLGRLTEVRRFAGQLSRQQISEAMKSNARHEIDVVRDLADVVPLRFACSYFGTPEPSPGAILEWFKAISFYVFAPKPYEWAEAAQIAGRKAAAHFTQLVADRHAAIASGQATPDDVLGRLIEMQSGPHGLADEAIARSLSFISGAMMPTSWLFIEAVDRLMRLPRRERKHLHRCAVEGDRAAVRAYVIEAARFFPFPYFIVRYAEREAEIGGKKVPTGTLVNLMVGAAVLDGSAVPQPTRFVPGRPESEYMLFGHAVHLCQGKDIAEEMLTEMAVALFSRVNLRRVWGPRGHVRRGSKKDIPFGPYPQSFVLRADT